MSKVILITGASKGIGYSTAASLLQKFGASVIAISRTISCELSDLKENFRDRLLIIEKDITDEAGVREAIDSAARAFGRLDGVVLNAGVVEPLATIGSPESKTSDWRSLFDVNFFSLLYTVQAAIPYLRESHPGRIIFISSGSATGNIGTMAAYNTSKAAMNSFCRTLANEEPGIVSVALRPGMVSTPMQTHIRETVFLHGMNEDDAGKFLGAHRDDKLVDPKVVGSVIASLALNAENSLSGLFVSWDGVECASYRRMALVDV